MALAQQFGILMRLFTAPYRRRRPTWLTRQKRMLVIVAVLVAGFVTALTSGGHSPGAGFITAPGAPQQPKNNLEAGTDTTANAIYGEKTPRRHAIFGLAAGAVIAQGQPAGAAAGTAAVGETSVVSQPTPPPPSSLDDVVMQWVQQLDLSFLGSNTTAGGEPAVDLTPSNIGLFLVGGLFLIIALNFKFIAAFAATIYAVNSFDGGGGKGGGNKAKKQLDNVVNRILGQPPDPLEDRRLQVTRLNDELTAMKASILEQTGGALVADELRNVARRERFLAEWEPSIGSVGLSNEERQKLGDAVKEFVDKEKDRREQQKDTQKRWIASVAKGDPFSKYFEGMKLGGVCQKEIKLQEELLQAIEKALPDKKKRQMVLDDLAERGSLQWFAGSMHSGQLERKHIYVLGFDGDPAASTVTQLSKEISAILAMPQKPHEVVLRLKSPGGTVTGYGLAGAQLVRITQQGIKLTVCVDELAASGGYLMASVADRIICSPFAAIGSIGVISAVPNFGDRLEREGLKVIETTAGKWKRTVVPYREPSEEEKKKAKEDIAMVYDQFRFWVQKNRPGVEIDEVATGEVWFGSDAMKKGLVDELMTSDEYLLRQIVEEDAEVLAVSYKQKAGGLLGSRVGAVLEQIAQRALQEGALGSAAELRELLSGDATVPGERRLPFTSVEPRFEAESRNGFW